jgi:hypothetical protein
MKEPARAGKFRGACLLRRRAAAVKRALGGKRCPTGRKWSMLDGRFGLSLNIDGLQLSALSLRVSASRTRRIVALSHVR